jgi:hypothetical protein
MDWKVRAVKFHSKGDPLLLNKVRAYIAVLLRIR